MKKFILCLGVVLPGLLYAGPAAACAVLEKASPRVGSTVSGPVNVVSLTFSMQVFPPSSSVDVLNERGHKMNVGTAFADGGKEMIATKVKSLPPGTYKVHWNVLAACGSKEPGNYKFTVSGSTAEGQ